MIKIASRVRMPVRAGRGGFRVVADFGARTGGWATSACGSGLGSSSRMLVFTDRVLLLDADATLSNAGCDGLTL